MDKQDLDRIAEEVHKALRRELTKPDIAKALADAEARASEQLRQVEERQAADARSLESPLQRSSARLSDAAYSALLERIAELERRVDALESRGT